jgi:iron complex outermembrane receptor protein
MAKIEIVVAVMLSLGQTALAQTGPQAPAKPAEQKDDLTSLDVMDLAKMQVTSASKKAESLFGVAAAISVVTAEDIKRSGATNIPEALRLVPGVQVAQVSATGYAVTIRGTNTLYSGQLLVLIDGRSIYNSFWGGVYWEDQAMSMDEIDRIEVIRGPGGTLWGANAVNGVINIITKQAKDTKGVYISASAATKGTSPQGTVRYGAALGHGDFRVTAYGLRDPQSLTANGTKEGNNRDGDKFSFRYDGGSESTGKVLLEGDIHRFSYQQTGTVPTGSYPFSASTAGNDASTGGSLLAKIEKTYANGSSNSLQATYDHNYKFIDPQLMIRDGTYDIQLQHGFQQIGTSNIITGASYRSISDDYTNAGPTVTPVKATTKIYSFFAQDQVTLNDTAKLTMGAKAEHNDYTGWEIEPSIRLSVETDANHTWWASLSRAVETPNRSSTGLQLPYQYFPAGANLPGQVVLYGNPNLVSTDMVAAETGYRMEINKRTTADVSIFQDAYTHLRSIAQGAGIPGDPYIIPVRETDIGSATVRGLEFSTKFQASSKLRFDFGYTYEYSDQKPGDFATPKHAIQELGTYTLSDKLSFDQAIYFNGGSSDGNASYTRMDVQLRYKPTKSCELSIGGRNLGQGNYTQLGAGNLASGGLVQPALYGQLTLKF